MKANADKHNLLVTSNAENYSIILEGIRIDSSSEEKLLADNRLQFDKHIDTLCKEASNKVHALIRTSRMINYASL